MTAFELGGRVGPDAQSVDLRRASLADLRALDLRAAERDLWADEAALWDRFEASWAGLDDAAWHLPGAAPSDAGGPDWTMAEHVGHLADWQELAIEYTSRAIQTGQWPAEDDFHGGDFDRVNEGRRAPWTTMSRDAILARLARARPRLLAQVGRLAPDVIRAHAAWGWVYMTLHGHYLDHLAVIEPWADELRRRQTDGDPFEPDPRAADHAGFVAQAAAIEADLERLLLAVPGERWMSDELTPGWTLRDHLAHLADWLDEGLRAIETYRETGRWPADPEEGIDAWNERIVARSRASAPAQVMARYSASRQRFLEGVGRLSVDELRSADGWAWAYDCLHGHLRKHLAMVGPWSARVGWPAPER